jgi:hypothetical protein
VRRLKVVLPSKSDGKIVAVGHASFAEFAVVRYLASGALDGSYGGDGIVTTGFTSFFGFVQVAGVVIQSDGRVVVAGSDLTGLTRFAVARYLGG